MISFKVLLKLDVLFVTFTLWFLYKETICCMPGKKKVWYFELWEIISDTMNKSFDLAIIHGIAFKKDLSVSCKKLGCILGSVVFMNWLITVAEDFI